MKQSTKVVLYLILILTGYLVGQFPYIPSFELGFIKYEQASIETLDKCVSITLLTFSIALFFVFWERLWLMLIMLFITWGFINNTVDEFANKATTFSTSEKISLLFALLTTSYLIWKHRQK